MSKSTQPTERDMVGPDSPHFSLPSDTGGESNAAGAPVTGWEEVAAGRFMPRRTRGSCVGRALG